MRTHVSKEPVKVRDVPLRAGAILVSLVLVAASGSARGDPVVWTPVGLAGQRVLSLVFSPADPNTLIAGLDTGYATSRNGGASFTVVTTGYATNAIAIDPTNPSHILAGTSVALARSTDGGGTFTPVLLETTLCLAIDPRDPNVVWAGTYDHIYKSMDRGVTWTAVYIGMGHIFVNALTIDPGNSNVVFAGLTFGDLAKTTDGGATWAVTSPGVPGVYALAVMPYRSNVVYAARSGGIYRSADGGATWTLSSKLTSFFGSGALLVDPQAAGTVFAGGSGGFAATKDDGATWNALSTGLSPPDIRSLAAHPTDHNHLFAGTAGGGIFSITFPAEGPPAIAVTSPNGGEVWEAGTTHDITWTSSGPVSAVRLEYSTNTLGPFTTIAASAPNSGQYAWLVSQELSRNCYVRVSDVSGSPSDTSDAPFEILHCGSAFIGPPFSASFDATGGSGSVGVTTTAGCAWTASSGVAWIEILSGTHGTGDGTVSYGIAPNLGHSPRTGALTIAGKQFTVTQSGALAGTEVVLFVPVVLDALGAGMSHFTSELTLTNRGANDTTVRLTYTGASTLGGGGGTAQIPLPAGRQMIVADTIAYLKSLSVAIPDSGDRGGTLSIGFAGLASPSEAGATVRTTTAVASGQAGLAYAGVPVWKALAGPAWICGLRESLADRSNVAIQNAGGSADGSVTLRVTVFSGDSQATVVLPDETLPPGGFKQYGRILAANGMTNGYVRIERVAGTAPYFAYGVVNDNYNSDGSFVPSRAERGDQVSGLTVPVVVEASVYTSELILTNRSQKPETLSLAFVSDLVTTSDATARISVAVRAGEQLIIPNIIEYFREQGASGIGPPGSGFVGALFVTPTQTDGSAIFVGARTSAPGGGGRYGLFYPGVAFGKASTSSAWLYGLQQNATTRTNLALVNTGEANDDADLFAIDIYDGETGQLARTESGVTLSSRRWTQMNAVLSRLAPGVTQGYAQVRKTQGTNPFITYAVINDGGVPQQRTDDGTFVASAE